MNCPRNGLGAVASSLVDDAISVFRRMFGGFIIVSAISTRRSVLRLIAGAAAGACTFANWRSWGAELADRLQGEIAPVHDPCIVREGNVYHLFCTGHSSDGNSSDRGGLLPWRTSTDLVRWQLNGSVLDRVPQWAMDAVPQAAGIWAPDISRCNDGYRLYYSVSSFGSNRSVIGLLSTPTLDRESPKFGWRDEGLVLESHPEDDFNAIDPNCIVDNKGHHWLALGSFWSGIKLFALDASTGKVRDRTRRYSLASRPVPDKAPGAIEAPFIIEREGFYYLFVSFDYCCRGASSSYYIVVGRSRRITGPYVGQDGRRMSQGYGTLLLQGDRRFRGPGHNAVLRDTDRDYLVYHAYDAESEGRPTLRISPINWSADGWPSVSS
jgi:arabinan endo-1,5-alpha-L-arabinosidase